MGKVQVSQQISLTMYLVLASLVVTKAAEVAQSKTGRTHAMDALLT